MIIQWFQPEPTLKGLPLAKEFVKLGHDVEILTGSPNYPGGKVYKGYRIRPLQRESIEGIPIIRVPLYPSHDRSGFRRFLNYASYALSASLIGPCVVRKADVAYVYHPPATVGLPAMAMKLLRGIPFAYDIQDLWPDSLSATEMFKSKTGFRLLHKWCRTVYKRASKIIVLSPGFKHILVERGVPEEKINVIYNWADDTVIKPVPKDRELARELGLEGKFNFMFAGNMGLAQALDTVLNAADLIQKDSPNAQIVFVGDGLEADKLKKTARTMNLANVRFIPRQPLSIINKFMALADVCLVHLKNDPLFKITIPSKIQSYLAMGRPILVALDGDAAELVLKANAGFACSPENPVALADTMRKFLRISEAELLQMGKNGREYYEKELSLEIGAERIAQTLASVIKNRS